MKRDLYFDDFEVGQTFSSKGCTLSEGQILDFAFRYDPQPFHVDASAEHNFDGIIASGFQTLCVAFRMYYQENIINACSMGSPGMDELRWPKPVRPGDTISMTGEVLEKRPSKSKPDRGIVRKAYKVYNQHGEVVMSFTCIHMMKRRPGE